MTRTPEQNRRYNQAAFAARIARGGCAAGCKRVMAKDSPWRVCDSCRAKQRDRYAPRGPQKLTKVFLPLSARMAIYQRYRAGGLTTRQLATAIGKSVWSVRAIIQKVGAAVRGFDVKPIGQRLGPRSAPAKLARCRCGLLLPCWNCPSAAEAATARSERAA